MAEYIEREAAIAIIEERQKQLCPVGMYSRHAVYGTDREKYDAWQEILDEIDYLPAANVRENVKGKWDMDSVAFYRKCPNCKCCVRDNRYEVFLDNGDLHFCPNCGADMTGGNDG